MKTVSIENFIGQLRNRPAICIGPGITAKQHNRDLVLRNLIEKHAKNILKNAEVERQPVEVILDAVRNDGKGVYEDIFLAYKSALKSVELTLEIEKLTKIDWCACVSFSDDSIFESALRDQYDQIATSRTVTEISRTDTVMPDRTLPIYRLMGKMNYIDPDSALAITESDLASREQVWHIILQGLPDFVKDNPLVFLGIDKCTRQLRNFLTVLRQMNSPRVTRLAFLEGSSILEDPTIKAHLAHYNVQVVDATMSEITAAIEDFRPSSLAKNQNLSSANTIKQLGDEFLDIFYLIEKSDVEAVDIEKIRFELVDALFRPNSFDFRPFWHDMDLRRTISEEIIEGVLNGVRNNDSISSAPVIIRGEAGIGKTTLLKRLGVDLVLSGYAVLWCKSAQRYMWSARLREFVDVINSSAESINDNARGVVIICDDPISLRISLAEIEHVLSNLLVPYQVVASVRTSEFFVSEAGFDANLSSGETVVELPFSLDELEIAGLADLLINIGVTQKKTEALRIVNNRNKDSAEDILCSLWYLVPETRQYLEESLSNEYLRLGSQDETIRGIATNAVNSSLVARTAYEIVTVTSSLGLGTPMEILVHALHVGYDEWVDLIRDDRPLWGLLYGEMSVSGETVEYRTRNHIVTKILLNIINHGTGNSGEFRALKRAISACGSAAIYREFIVDILVRNRAMLEKLFSYAQGDELFNSAKEQLGIPDKLLEQHHGIWMAHKGTDTVKAYKQLEKALDVPDYPSDSQKVKNSHIKTSQAALIVQRVKNEEVDPKEGLDQVRELLREISRSGVSDPYSSHIHAGMLFDLSERESIDPNVRYISLSEAFAEINDAMVRVGSEGKRRKQKSIKDIEALRALRRKILESIGDADIIEQVAEEIYAKSGSSDGFRVVFHILFSKASISGKGKDYKVAYEYINGKINKYCSSTSTPLVELYCDRADVAVKWQLHGMKAGINWDQLKNDLAIVLNSPQYSEDLMKLFYSAVARYHCGERTDANSIFSILRRKNLDFSLFPYRVRCVYLGKEGAPKRFQGTVGSGGGIKHVTIDELEDSIKVPENARIGSAGETVHVYVGFTLNGTLILDRRPEQNYYELS